MFIKDKKDILYEDHQKKKRNQPTSDDVNNHNLLVNCLQGAVYSGLKKMALFFFS